MSDKMTISVALRRIKKLKGQMAEHTNRAIQGVSYAQGKAPAFPFQEAVVALNTARNEMLDLESKVAVANAKKTVTAADGSKLTLTRAIRQLQELKGQMTFLRSLHLRSDTVREREVEWNDEKMQNITRLTEVTYVSDLSEQDRDREIKLLQDQFETLNNAVEEANHSVLV